MLIFSLTLLSLSLFAGFYVSSVDDVDGNSYGVVIIGKQSWMATNLKVAHYRNGDAITHITDDNEWGKITTGAWCNYNNDAANDFKYGKLYNWYAVSDPRNIAPVGWHVATDADWKTLSSFLGGETVAGGKLKEAGTINWLAPNTDATNQYRFNALPGGFRGANGRYFKLNEKGEWYSIYKKDKKFAFNREMFFDDSNLHYSIGDSSLGYSVRCVKD